MQHNQELSNSLLKDKFVFLSVNRPFETTVIKEKSIILNHCSKTSAGKLLEAKSKILELLQLLDIREDFLKDLEKITYTCMEKIKKYINKFHTFQFIMKCLTYYNISTRVAFKVFNIDILNFLSVRRKDYIAFKFIINKSNNDLTSFLIDSKDIIKEPFACQYEQIYKNELGLISFEDKLNKLWVITKQYFNKLKDYLKDLCMKELHYEENSNNQCRLEESISYLMKEENELLNINRKISENTNSSESIYFKYKLSDVFENVLLINSEEFIELCKNFLHLTSEVNFSLFEQETNFNIFQKSSLECLACSIIRYVIFKKFGKKITLDIFDTFLNHSKFTLSKKNNMLKNYITKLIVIC